LNNSRLGNRIGVFYFTGFLPLLPLLWNADVLRCYALISFVSVNQLLRQFLFALEAVAVRVLPNTDWMERPFASRTLTCLFISIEYLLTHADWLQLG
jgi:hypothetical protein